MAEKEQKFLSEIDFSELLLWDVKNLFSNTKISSQFKMIRLRDILIQYKNSITLDDNEEYKLCGLSSYGNGLFHREIKKGLEIKSKKLFKIKKNTFIYSRLGAHNGSFDFVGDNFDSYFVTNEFPTFEFDNRKVNIEYLKVIFKSKIFWEEIGRMLQGAAHKRFSEEKFLNLKIPLPSLLEQKKIVENYNQKIKEAKEAEKKAEGLEQNIEKYLMEELGIEKVEKEEKKKGIQEVNFKNIFEWGVDKIIGLNRFKSSKFKIINLEKDNSLYVDAKRGKSPKYSDKSHKIILNQKCNRWDEINLSFTKKVEEDWFNSIQKDFFTREGDILINSTGEGTIGRATSINTKNVGLLYDSHLLLLRLNSDLVNYKFYTLFFNTKLGQEQIDVIKSAQATKQTELGTGNLKKISFPLPPLSIQEKIVEKISAMKKEIKELKKLSEENRKNAIIEFEKEIFSE